jgi:hypothetical protein
MKNQLLIATLAVGFLAGLGIAAVRGDFSQPAAAPDQGSSQPAAAVPLQAMAVRPLTAASDPEPDDRESADSLPAPTYDEDTASRDRAAAHSARSR